MASAESETEEKVTSVPVEGNDDETDDNLSDVDFLHNELANVNRKLEVMHLALEKARQDHKHTIESKDKDFHNLQEQINDMQENVDRLKFEKERLLSKGNLREIDMAGLKREIDNLKLQLHETEAKAKKREDVNAVLMAQEQTIKEELKEELKEEMDRNTHALHDDMLAILREVQAEKKDVAAILQEVQTEKKDVAEVKRGMHKITNKGKYHKHCMENKY
ncbi:uncharacterized protein PF3D7_1120000-like [Mercenaria mercenaria]|uniref:uncharacterized protein PF3D7_1120000-like n=1 Tax=Mercenaria mercenaria TaxID=6596 RepID=UPI00234E5AB8|nr:uncharacterized protein PF3D7_1120000-like [Mercenaria mercenaria]